jgi:hypothetical protein
VVTSRPDEEEDDDVKRRGGGGYDAVVERGGRAESSSRRRELEKEQWMEEIEGRIGAAAERKWARSSAGLFSHITLPATDGSFFNQLLIL